MKGVMTLEIEIDYERMFQHQGLENLMLFTGAQSTDELIDIHMNALNNDLLEVINKKPLVVSKSSGKIIRQDPLEADYKEVEGAPEQEPVANTESEQVPEQETVTDAEVVSGEVVDMPNPIVNLNNDLNEVSIRLGIPTMIRVNAVMMRILSEASGNQMINQVNGFPTELESMEELYVIQYKEYTSNEVKQFSPSNGLTLI